MTNAAQAEVPASLSRELRALLAALTFLTRIPIGRTLVLNGDDSARAGATFPLVGAGIGALVGGLATVLAQPLSPLLAVVLALAAGTLVTGALHLDAVADTADALGARSRERALAIMREHTIGAYGATAIAFDLLVKTAVLSTLVERHHAVRFAVAAGALARAVPVLLAAFLPYARTEGAGAALARGTRSRALVAAAFAVGLVAIVAGRNGLLLAVGAAVLAFALGAAFRGWLGAVTGDLLGAAVELTEIALLVSAIALVSAR